MVQPGINRKICFAVESWVFFFQAEDGIRGLTVTGVQTCALPISVRDYDDYPAPGARDRGPAVDHLRHERHHDHLQAAAVRRAPLLLLLAATPLLPIAAQEPAAEVSTVGRTGVVFDGYYFGSPFAFSTVVQWTVPLTLAQRVGRRLTVDLSSAFARASGATTSGTLEVSGFTDTDVRASWATVSGHLIISAVATLPTGRKAVSASTPPLLSALATELLAFTTPTFGSGGGATGGFATAFRLGERWAGGVAASFRWHASYTPIAGSGQLEPGGEGRMRLGVEGSVGRGGYLRGAAVYTASGADTLRGGSRSITGDRILVYSSVGFPAGSSNLALY